MHLSSLSTAAKAAGDYDWQPGRERIAALPSLSVNLLEEEHLVRRVEGRKARACDEEPQDNLSYYGQLLDVKRDDQCPGAHLRVGLGIGRVGHDPPIGAASRGLRYARQRKIVQSELGVNGGGGGGTGART